jgi:LacI family transcriptional regulator
MPKPVKMRWGKKPKLRDVAKAAGVSPATVSRVLNNPKIVRPTVQQKVRRAIVSLGFTPDPAARALKSRKSRTVGAVVPTLGVAIFAEGTGALQSGLRDHGYTLLIASSEYDSERERQEIGVFLDRGVDGIILVGDRFADDIEALAQRHDIPIITTYISESSRRIPAIGVDNSQAMREVTDYLIELGHREFAIVTDSTRSNDRTAARRDGVLRALRANGIRLTPNRIVEVPYSIANGRAALRMLLQAAPQTTAIVCTSDALAIGVIAESKTLGLVVPRDLSVTGCDDIEISAHTDPPLTSVNMPAAEIGRLAADHLSALMSGLRVPLVNQLPARLVIRSSAAAPRRR